MVYDMSPPRLGCPSGGHCIARGAKEELGAQEQVKEGCFPALAASARGSLIR